MHRRALRKQFFTQKIGTLATALAFTRAMHIQSIPMWVGSSDNYAYLVVDDKSKDAVIIDPAHPKEVSPVLKKAISDGKINLTAIVNTHHHWDHAGGNDELRSDLNKPSLPIIAGKDAQSVTKTPADGESFKIGDISVKALYTPCHTQDSICWYMEDGDDRVVFTGDTLFHAGCGKFFEGTGPEMNKALNKTLAALPDDTRVFPGHEYTKSNVKFAISVIQNEAIKKLQSFAENNKETQGKFTIGDEKAHNPFMRVDDPVIQKATGATNGDDVMTKLREMKNSFRQRQALANFEAGAKDRIEVCTNRNVTLSNETKILYLLDRLVSLGILSSSSASPSVLADDPPKRKAGAGADSGAPTKARQSKLAKENDITAQEEAEIKEAFSLFSEPMEGEKEGVIPTDDVRRAMIALDIPPKDKDELNEFISILDPDNEGFATYPSFVAICALKLHARDDGDEAHLQEVNDAFALFTGGNVDGSITLAHLKRVAAVLKEEVDDELLRDMILEANGGSGVGKGVKKDEFEKVMQRAGVWR